MLSIAYVIGYKNFLEARQHAYVSVQLSLGVSADFLVSVTLLMELNLSVHL